MGHPPLPPTDLALPAYVGESIGRREQSVVEQGFTEAELRLSWWNAELARVGLGSESVTVDPNNTGAKRLTRGALFHLAKCLSDSADDADILRFLWHVLIWGSGTSRRNNRERIVSFTTADSAASNVELLRTALRHAQAGTVAESYSGLIRRGGGEIPGLGPAFFTKLLYFAGAGDPSHPCLILDARVAASLHAAGWTTLPRSKRGAGWSFGANWYTATYVAYCTLLERWAEAEGNRRASSVAADEIEVALFRNGGSR